ncbi:MAG: hypothetical protein OXD54_05965 [Candidatus Poribacteria bacterium]|nr:hypothetical protein [Candidatus Poribacteria bacterium]
MSNGLVRIAEGTEPTENTENSPTFTALCVLCAFSDSDNPAILTTKN